MPGPLVEDPHGLGGHRARRARQFAAVDAVHGLHVPQCGGQEDLVRPVQDVQRQVRLLGSGPVDRQGAGDAREAAGGERRGVDLAVEDDEDVGAGALAELADGVGEQRLGGAVFTGPGQGDDVLGVRGGLQAGERAAFVAGPGDGDTAVVSGRRGGLAERDDERRAGVAAVGAERCHGRRCR